MGYLLKPSFAAGELSPAMYGRTDIAKYDIGAAKLENFVVLRYGGVQNRAGTRYIAKTAGNKKAGEFSLGMRQRLGIAVALLGDPQFLILDEPVNGLDPEGIKEIRDIILRLNRERGVTFLISSHLLDELAKIVTKYGIISDGVLLEEVTPAELERRCRSGLKIVVDDAAKALSVLEGRIAKSDVSVDGNALLLRSASEYAGKINGLLVKSGVEVKELFMQHGGFEDYFIERIGR